MEIYLFLTTGKRHSNKSHTYRSRDFLIVDELPQRDEGPEPGVEGRVWQQYDVVNHSQTVAAESFRQTRGQVGSCREETVRNVTRLG